jgi:hypothetical protein
MLQVLQLQPGQKLQISSHHLNPSGYKLVTTSRALYGGIVMGSRHFLLVALRYYSQISSNSSDSYRLV